MLSTGRNLGVLAAAILAGGLFFVQAFAGGASSGTPDSSKSAENAGLQSNDSMVRPKHKARAAHNRQVANRADKRHLASRTKIRMHEFALRESTRGRLIDAREDRTTAQLNDRQIDEARASVSPASYGGAAEARGDVVEKKKRTPGLTPATGAMIPITSSDAGKGESAY